MLVRSSPVDNVTGYVIQKMEVGSERTCNRLPCSRLCRLKKTGPRTGRKGECRVPTGACVTKFCLCSLGFPVFRPFRAISIFGRHSRSSENSVDFHTAQLLPLFLQPQPSLCLKSIGVIDVFIIAVPPPLAAVPPPFVAVPPAFDAVPPAFVADPPLPCHCPARVRCRPACLCRCPACRLCLRRFAFAFALCRCSACLRRSPPVRRPKCDDCGISFPPIRSIC